VARERYQSLDWCGGGVLATTPGGKGKQEHTRQSTAAEAIEVVALAEHRRQKENEHPRKVQHVHVGVSVRWGVVKGLYKGTGATATPDFVLASCSEWFDPRSPGRKLAESSGLSLMCCNAWAGAYIGPS